MVNGSAIVRFLAAAQAPRVAVHSPVAVRAGVQLAPAAPVALPAWAAAAEVAEAAAGADKSQTQFIGKLKERPMSSQPSKIFPGTIFLVMVVLNHVLQPCGHKRAGICLIGKAGTAEDIRNSGVGGRSADDLCGSLRYCHCCRYLARKVKTSLHLQTPFVT